MQIRNPFDVLSAKIDKIFGSVIAFSLVMYIELTR